MRKDGKSQYTIKKEKLLKIKKILKEQLKEEPFEIFVPACQYDEPLIFLLNRIWELVKDEK